MPTTVTKTIGTSSRDYSTVQAWEDASPANLVSSDQIWRGECYNDAEFTASSSPLVLIAGSTSDATRYKELTAAAGQSFQDAAGVRSNALTYNASNGVGLRRTNAATGRVIDLDEDYARISRLQVCADNNTGYVHYVIDNSSLTERAGTVVKDCLLENKFLQNGSVMRVRGHGSVQPVFYNVLGILSGSGGDGFDLRRNVTLIGCTIVRLTDDAAAGTGIVLVYDTSSVLQSCAVFGFSTCVTASKWDTTASKNNATSNASGLPGSSNQHSVTFNGTTPFTQAALSGNDLRSIAATSLAANGFKDATNAPNDISATARAATPTIGHWELVTAAAAIVARAIQAKQAVNRSATY